MWAEDTGLGTGFIRTKGHSGYVGSVGSRTGTNFAWDIGLGLGCQITNNVVLDIGYRFTDPGRVSTNRNDRSESFELETKCLY